MRTFDTGATRDDDTAKPKYGAYLSPLVIQRFGEYMLQHEVQADGVRREAGNWKKGIPKEQYFESLFRHFIQLWRIHDFGAARVDKELEDTLCAIMFNTMGYLHEVLK